MIKFSIPIFFIFFAISCKSQLEQAPSNKLIGGPCEGCEAIYEYGDKQLSNLDTLPGFAENDPKLKVTGTIFQKDGKTPAKDVILYIYHTDRDGIYKANVGAKGWEKRHGSYRAWLKTDADGRYTFYTFRPAAYPNGREAEHIHLTVKEPDKNDYYIDSIFFEDDPLLTKTAINRHENRGGSGITQPVLNGEIFELERNIYLGKNIPDYP